jgi:hypothetical protein
MDIDQNPWAAKLRAFGNSGYLASNSANLFLFPRVCCGGWGVSICEWGLHWERSWNGTSLESWRGSTCLCSGGSVFDARTWWAYWGLLHNPVQVGGLGIVHTKIRSPRTTLCLRPYDLMWCENECHGWSYVWRARHVFVIRSITHSTSTRVRVELVSSLKLSSRFVIQHPLPNHFLDGMQHIQYEEPEKNSNHRTETRTKNTWSRDNTAMHLKHSIYSPQRSDVLGSY